MILISNCNCVYVHDITLKSSPMEHLAFSSPSNFWDGQPSNNVTINNVTVNTSSSSPNTDGIDPSGTHFLITNCNVSDGDDNIVVKPQIGACADITITGCTIGSGHGLSVGGETNEGLNGLLVTHCTMSGTSNGIRLKASRGNGGLCENLIFSDITMSKVSTPFLFESYYPSLPSDPSSDKGQSVTSTTPIWQNIVVQNTTITGSSTAGTIWGLPEMPISNVSFKNVQISASKGMTINHADSVSFDSSSSRPSSSPASFTPDTRYRSPSSRLMVIWISFWSGLIDT
jgi:polygalacturonase